MFHYKESLYFGRKKDGSVRMVKFPSSQEKWPNADAERYELKPEFDIVIDTNAWASIVSSVSVGGEDNGRFYIARKFHEGLI